jgi:hypothetical protein
MITMFSFSVVFDSDYYRTPYNYEKCCNASGFALVWFHYSVFNKTRDVFWKEEDAMMVDDRRPNIYADENKAYTLSRQRSVHCEREDEPSVQHNIPMTDVNAAYVGQFHVNLNKIWC